MSGGMVGKGVLVACFVLAVAFAGCVDSKPAVKDAPAPNVPAKVVIKPIPLVMEQIKYSGSTPQRTCAATTFLCIPPSFGGASGGTENPHTQNVTGTPQTIHIEITWSGSDKYTASVSALTKNASNGGQGGGQGGMGGNRNSRVLLVQTGASPLVFEMKDLNWTKEENRVSIRVSPISSAPPPLTFINDPGIKFEVVGNYVAKA